MPLPKPRPGEKESEFIARCTIDAEVENEFPTLSQRLAVCYSLYEGKQQKAAKYDTVAYYQGFERQLSIGERKELSKVFRYHVNQYDQAIKQFLATGKTEGWTELFKTEDLVNIYTNIYVNIGTRVSEWYTRNFERYNKKFDPAQYRDVFAFKFAALANQVAGTRVTSVQDNRKQVLIKELKRFFSDPEFQALNERDAQKLLRDRFKGISKYQAERIIRTESVAAANYATSESAKQMFNEQDLMKEWITAEDGRVRRIPRDQASHRAMNGVTIEASERFKVPTKNGIDLLMFPGDPNGSPSNVINCRCTVAYVPKEAAEATMTIQGFGVQDLEQVQEQGENFGVVVNAVVGETLQAPVAEKTREQIIRERIEQNRPEEWDKITQYASSRTGKPVELNDDFLEFVDIEGYRYIFRGKGAHHDRFSREIKLANSDWTYRERTIYHEFGHNIHDSLEVFNRAGDQVNPKFAEFFDEMVELTGMSKRGKKKQEALDEIRKTIPTLKKNQTNAYWDVKDQLPERYKDLYDKLGQLELEEQWHSLADFFGAITKNTVGWGHRNVYYRGSVFKQYAEMFAHMSEWYFGKHDLVKAAFPEVYERAMQVMEELFEEYRQLNGY